MTHGTELDIDIPALTTLLDGHYVHIRHEVRTRLRTDLADPAGLDLDGYRDKVRQALLDLAATGLPAYAFPTQYGGGDDVGASIAAFETMAFGDLSLMIKVGVQYGLFGGAILQLGTQQHHDRYLSDVVAGRLLGCFAMTEKGHGSDVQGLETTAEYDGDRREFIVNTPSESAHKEFIGGAAHDARLAVVFAQLEVAGTGHGVHALLVPLRDDRGAVLPGIRIEDDGGKIGLNGVDNGKIWFDHVRVPRENLLNRYGDVSADGVYSSPIDSPDRRFFTMLGNLVQGRVSVGGAAINAAKVALTIAIRYADQRRQFADSHAGEARKLLDYGLHQRRLLPRLARTYALHFAQQALISEYHTVFSGPEGADDADRRHRALESRAAGTKALATWLATDTIQACREACGGAGYMSENRFDALRADTDVFTTFEGDNHILLQLVAKGLLTNYSSGFDDLDQLGMVRFVAGQAVEAIIERTSVHALLDRIRDVMPGDDRGSNSDAGPLDSNDQLAMFRWREEHRIAGLARRLKRGVDEGMGAAEVFSRCQDHAIAAARAHVERLALEAFTTEIRSLSDGANKTVLTMVCDVFALTTLEEDRGWWMEHGRLTSQRSKAITRQIDDLLRRLRPIAVDLVDAFGVPDVSVQAPLLR